MTEIKKVKVTSKASTSCGIAPKRSKQKGKIPDEVSEKNSAVIRLEHIPYGFFERELKGYFSQFGKIRRVRVLRNKKVSLYK